MRPTDLSEPSLFRPTVNRPEPSMRIANSWADTYRCLPLVQPVRSCFEQAALVRYRAECGWGSGWRFTIRTWWVERRDSRGQVRSQIQLRVCLARSAARWRRRCGAGSEFRKIQREHK
jgi:hypothetical protein